MTVNKFGLRTRMSLLFVFCLAVILSYLLVYWLPRMEQQTEKNFKDGVQAHLLTVAEVLKPFLMQQDYGAIHELLPATLKKNPDWAGFSLLDHTGKRVYPLIQQAVSDPDGKLWVFSQAIEFRGTALGVLDLSVDYRAQLDLMRQRNLEMVGTLILAMIGALTLIIGFTDLTVVRPLRQLAAAANRLAEGDFNAQLPQVGTGEMGELTSSFSTMREKLRINRDALTRARDELEDRVELRTAELLEANERLVAESEDRERVEAHLRQAQRLESLGKLTGGVAHDFNNLMAVIGGHAELLRDRIGDNASLTAIERATNRATTLTQHLLAFSRQQRLRPNAIDLRHLIIGLEHLYQRTLGEKVRIVSSAAPDVWPVLADAGQLDNALLNLSINARDAMPRGGTLSITCRNVHFDREVARVSDQPMPAGDYVRIDVSDTGEGIPPETLARVFEPFFTTKEVGKGSGLGLSMVFGFARQSGGDVQIDSEVGRGTRVSIYLPRAVDSDEIDGVNNASAEFQPGLGRCVLVIEDEDDVRSFIVEVLESLGYRVLEAADAYQAEALLGELASVEMILSDVVLPGGISGPEFASGQRATNPNLRIVYMTGYAPDLSELEGKETSEHVLLRKPFTRRQLAQALHESFVSTEGT